MKKQDYTYQILNELQKFWESNPELRFSQVVSYLKSKIDYYYSNSKALEILTQLNKEKEESNDDENLR